MAAGLGKGIRELTEMIEECVYADRVEREFMLPYDKGDIVAYFRENATVLRQEYCENGVRLRVNCHKNDAEKYLSYASAI